MKRQRKFTREKKFQVTAVSKRVIDKGFNLPKILHNEKYYSGVEFEPFKRLLNTVEKENLSLKDNEFRLEHGQILDMSKDKDFFIVARAFMYPEIALSRESINPDTHKLFLNDVYEEAEDQNRAYDAKAEAFVHIKTDITEDNIKQLYIFLGESDFASSPRSVIMNNIKRIADESPERLNRYFDNYDSIKDEVFIKELIHDNLINQTADGYYYLDRLLATSLTQLVVKVSNDRDLKNTLTTAHSERFAPAKATNPKSNQDDGGVDADKIKYRTLEQAYTSITGRAYEGKRTIVAIEEAIKGFNKEMQENQVEKQSKKEKQAFVDKYKSMSLDRLKQSARLTKGLKSKVSEWQDIQEQEEMYEYMYNNKFDN